MIWGRTDEVREYWLARLDVLKRRWPRVGNEIASMTEASKRFFDNEKPNEALKLASDAKRVFTDFNNEVEEVVAQLARRLATMERRARCLWSKNAHRKCSMRPSERYCV